MCIYTRTCRYSIISYCLREMEDLYTDGYLSVYIDTGMGFVIYTRP